MTEQEQNLLNGFKVKLQRLIALHDQKVLENQQLLKRVELLDEELNSLKKEKDVLAKKYENLKLVKAMLVSDAGNQEAKNRINKIVREIDKCIAMLNQ